MDRQLLERMIGAAVLIVFLIVVVPAILDSPGEGPPPVPVVPEDADSLRQVTIRPMAEAQTPPLAQARESADKPPPVRAEPQTPATAQSRPDAEADDSSVRPSPAPTVATPPAKPKPPPPKPKPQPKPAPAPPSAAAPGWVVQLGSFANRQNAQALAKKLRDAGFESYLLPLERDDKTLYRVRVGPAADSKAAAEKLAAGLLAAGHSGRVMRQEPEA